MGNGCSKSLSILFHMGVNHNNLSFFDRMFNLKYLVWALGCILFHRKPERICIALEEGIMVAKALAYITLIRFVYFPRCNKLQERYCIAFKGAVSLNLLIHIH